MEVAAQALMEFHSGGGKLNFKHLVVHGGGGWMGSLRSSCAGLATFRRMWTRRAAGPI